MTAKVELQVALAVVFFSLKSSVMFKELYSALAASLGWIGVSDGPAFIINGAYLAEVWYLTHHR